MLNNIHVLNKIHVLKKSTYLGLAVSLNKRPEYEKSKVSLEHLSEHLRKQGHFKHSFLLVRLVVVQ